MTDVVKHGERLTAVEQTVVELRSDWRHMRDEVHDVKQTVGKVGDNVEELLRRDASRPQQQSARAIIGTIAALFSAIGILAMFVWWFISVSPTVTELDKRVTRLDDPEMGKVNIIEERVRAVEQWRPTVYRH